MISTKGRYALRVMIDLAEHGQETAVALKEIAQRQEISKKYLEILVKTMVGGGLIVGVGGKGGGYRLTRKPEDYSVGEILDLMEGSLAAVACLEKNAEACPRAAFCRTLPLWKEYNQLTHGFFYGKSLSDLIADSEGYSSSETGKLTEEGGAEP